MLMLLHLLSLLPTYQGPQYSGESYQIFSPKKTFINLPVAKDPDKNLASGTFLRHKQYQVQKQTCTQSYQYESCTITKRTIVLQPKVQSFYMCKGCPYCHDIPCCMWPCDSGMKSACHSHSGSDAWFPERTNCPFIEKRPQPVTVSPEKTQEVIEDTCTHLHNNSAFTLVSQNQNGAVQHRTYQTLTQDTCKAINLKECLLQEKQCTKKNQQGFCTLWTYTYSCHITKEVVQKMPSFTCKPGHAKQEPPNKAIGQALGSLQGLSQSLADNVDTQSLRVFSGQPLRCHIDMVHFRDCCKTMDGWGQSLGFGCTQEEQTLASLRAQNRCSYVGSWISHSIIGAPARKQKVFCCFPSHLIRLLREHAQAQLNKPWGFPEEPQCQGITVVGELDCVNFATINPEAMKSALMHTNKSLSYDDLKSKIINTVKRMDHAY